MPLQLRRLLFLFAVFIGLFLIIRHFLVPESFGQYGHYRGEALIDNTDKELVYASGEDCTFCHSDIGDMIQEDMHAEISCLACHGPGMEHINNPEANNIHKESSREFCGRCHAINTARPSDVIVQVDIESHHKEKDQCINCHNPHQVWDIKE